MSRGHLANSVDPDQISQNAGSTFTFNTGNFINNGNNNQSTESADGAVA